MSLTGKDELLDKKTREGLVRSLGPQWRVDNDVLVRRIDYKGYANIARFVGQVAELSERMNHHPEVQFGWGYCEVRFTTHSANGLTRMDFDAAKQIDRLAETAFPKA